MANNHSMDLGKIGYENTKTLLKQQNIKIAGLNDQGIAFKIKGKTIRLIAFSYNGKNNVNSIMKSKKLIQSFKEDIIIVSAHMGSECADCYNIQKDIEYYQNESRGNVRLFAKSVIDAGADLVIGHGPHLLRGLELYKKRFIMYSLGNFIFDYPGVDRVTNNPSCAVVIKLSMDGRFNEASIKNYNLYRGIPYIDKKNKAFHFIKNLSNSSENTNLKFKNNSINLLK